MYVLLVLTMSRPLLSLSIDVWKLNVNVLPMNFALQEPLKAKKFVLKPTGNVKLPLLMLTVMRKR